MNSTTKFCTALLLSLNLTAGVALWQDTRPVLARTAEETTANRVYARANPAVVTVRLNQRHGSGFIISKDGFVVTNAHVVKDGPGIPTVIMADGTEVAADLVGFATDGIDLALLKINRHGKKLPVVGLGTVKSLKVGDGVYAIGTPLGEVNQNTFTSGIVSAIRANGSLVQHNAAINPGNSGGPLLNDRGEVVGVNTFLIASPVVDSDGELVGRNKGNVGVNYAIGADVVRQFLTNAQLGKISPVATIEGK